MIHRLCHSLRWKGFYGKPFQDQASLEAALSRNEVPYRCLQTCQAWGPDDAGVTPEQCQPGRGCFSPSDRDPLRRFA